MKSIRNAPNLRAFIAKNVLKMGTQKKSRPEADQLDALREEVWKRVIGNKQITKGNHYYEQIRVTILRETAFSLSKDTIRNFCEKKHIPSPKTLDIYSTFVLNGSEQSQKTFTDFQTWYSSKETLPGSKIYLNSNRYKYFVLVGGLGLIILLVSTVLTIQSPSSEQDYIYSHPDAVSSPQIQLSTEKIPDKDLILTLLSDFPYDKSKNADKKEAQRILEWIGVRKMTYDKRQIEPTLSGFMENDCKLSILINPKELKNTYGIYCDCSSVVESSKLSYVEITKPRKTHSFYKRFFTANLVELKADGWNLFPDSINPKVWDNTKYSSNGYLTLETFPGDSYLENRSYQPTVINILAKEITCGSCCEILVKIVDFNPNQLYQQAGFFIFYENIPYPSMRMTLAYTGGITVTRRNAKYSNSHLITIKKHKTRAQVYKMANGKILNPNDSIVLKMRIENNQYFFSFKKDNNDFIDITSQSFDFPSPKHIGLAAFQGRPDIPYPVQPLADTIPANFEYVRLISCDN